MVDGETKHEKCLMSEEWGKISAELKNLNRLVIKHIQSQSDINMAQTAALQKIMHRIYGNAEEGMLSDIRVNRMDAQHGIESVESSIARLYWVLGLLMVPVIAASIKILFF